MNSDFVCVGLNNGYNFFMIYETLMDNHLLVSFVTSWLCLFALLFLYLDK